MDGGVRLILVLAAIRRQFEVALLERGLNRLQEYDYRRVITELVGGL
jgi:hypothetical protein